MARLASRRPDGLVQYGPPAGLAFTSLWPVPNAGLKEAALAAASMAARGLHYDSAVPVLVDAQKQAAPGAYRDHLDLALLQSYLRHQKYEDACGSARRLYEDFPESDAAFNQLSTALADSAHLDELTKLVDARLEKEPASPAVLRAEARILKAEQRFSDVVATLGKVTRTAKVTAGDWNSLAWASLFTKDVGTATLG